MKYKLDFDWASTNGKKVGIIIWIKRKNYFWYDILYCISICYTKPFITAG